jgi:hypothetical protein
MQTVEIARPDTGLGGFRVVALPETVDGFVRH